MESLVFNNRRIFEEVLDRSSVQEVEGDVAHDFTYKIALEATASFLEVISQLWQKGFGLGERIDLEVYAASAIRAFTDLPIGVQPAKRREGGPDLVKQVRSRVPE
jgi:hypothetical protein